MTMWLVFGGGVAIYCLIVYAVAAFLKYATKDLP